jgi:hypothetical protein
MLDLATLVRMMVPGMTLERIQRPSGALSWLARALDAEDRVIVSCDHETPEGALDHVLTALMKRGCKP